MTSFSFLAGSTEFLAFAFKAGNEASSLAESSYTTLMTAGGALILVLAVIMVIVRIFMKKYDPRSQEDVFSGGRLTIEQAEGMYSKGLISEEEFSALRDRVLDVSTDDKNGSPLSAADSIIEKEPENKDSEDDNADDDNSFSSPPPVTD